MDAMVTARMSREKKEAGSRVLASLGSSASRAINELYDYAIAHGCLPFGPAEELPPRSDRLVAAVGLVDSLPKVTLDAGFEGMGGKEARIARLRDASLLDAVE